MVYELMELGRLRYVGERSTKIVHDRWHPDCDGCGLYETVRRGDAAGFEPDSLDGALLEGYEYCEACFDKTEPSPPKWASPATPAARREASEPQPPAQTRARESSGVAG
ncbi:MAG: hypothetical protein ABIK85_10885 [Candidatus Eisenbacteria bacterium]